MTHAIKKRGSGRAVSLPHIKKRGHFESSLGWKDTVALLESEMAVETTTGRCKAALVTEPR